MKTSRPWIEEALLLFVLLGLATGFGLYFGHLTFSIAIALALYAGWHLQQVYRFSRWLGGTRKRHFPFYVGAWKTMFESSAGLRKQNRKRKRRLGEMLSSFQESTSALPDATIVLDDKGAMQWWNPAAKEIFGLKSKKYRGSLLLEKVESEALGEYLEEQRYEKPLKLVSPIDHSVMLEIRVVPYGKGKRLLQARDISRLQQLETVRQDFVANVSHEMRTPLTVIHGYLETMAVGAEQNGQSHWQGVIGQMRQQTDRLQRIVEDLLLLSRLDSGIGRQGEEMVAVAEMLAALCDEAHRLSGDMDHRIRLEARPGLNLLGNGSEIYSLFSNLVFNAVRYTPARGEIRVTWDLVDKEACFTVTDDGIGIEKEHLPRLTERFYRVDVGRSRKSGGTGLGLAIAKHVVNRHGGKLEIESEPGVGSTFRCCFPGIRVVSSSN